MRRLPDGTWYDPRLNLVRAPFTQPYGGGEYKRLPSPEQGSNGTLFVGLPPDSQAMAINGLGASPMPGQWGMHMRQGRNYAALGILDNLSPAMRQLVAIGAVIGVAALTVWLRKRSEKRSKK